MIEYLVRVTCDAHGCSLDELFAGASDALANDWSMITNTGGWLCPVHSREWRELNAPITEPTDEDLLA